MCERWRRRPIEGDEIEFRGSDSTTFYTAQPLPSPAILRQHGLASSADGRGGMLVVAGL